MTLSPKKICSVLEARSSCRLAISKQRPALAGQVRLPVWEDLRFKLIGPVKTHWACSCSSLTTWRQYWSSERASGPFQPLGSARFVEFWDFKAGPRHGRRAAAVGCRRCQLTLGAAVCGPTMTICPWFARKADHRCRVRICSLMDCRLQLNECRGIV